MKEASSQAKLNTISPGDAAFVGSCVSYSS